MSVNAITLKAPVKAQMTTFEPVKTEKKQAKSNTGKIVAVGISAAALAAMAAIAIKKKGAKAVTEAADALPKDFVLGENGIKTLFGKINAKAMDKQIAEVAERTSEAGVNKWLEHFGEGAEHVVQKASIVG